MGMLINRHRDRNGDSQDGSPSKDWKVADLKAYASSNDVDLTGVKKKADILEAITVAERARAEEKAAAEAADSGGQV